MDINMQIQGIKTEFYSMKLQIENIEMQNNNIMNKMMMNNPIGDQMLNLSIQMINTGLQTFKSGKYMSINSIKYFDKLKKISEQINEMINSLNMEMQQQMMQQEMMRQQMMQQQMMQQQMIQQQMMQQQMMQQQMMQQQENNMDYKVNIIFNGNFKAFCIPINPYETIKDLTDRFKKKFEKDNGLKNALKNGDFELLYNASKIEKNSLTKIKVYFMIDISIYPYETIKDLTDRFKNKIEEYNGLNKILNNGDFELLYNASKINKNSLTKIKDYFRIGPLIPTPSRTITVIFCK